MSTASDEHGLLECTVRHRTLQLHARTSYYFTTAEAVCSKQISVTGRARMRSTPKQTHGARSSRFACSHAAVSGLLVSKTWLNLYVHILAQGQVSGRRVKRLIVTCLSPHSRRNYFNFCEWRRAQWGVTGGCRREQTWSAKRDEHFSFEFSVFELLVSVCPSPIQIYDASWEGKKTSAFRLKICSQTTFNFLQKNK